MQMSGTSGAQSGSPVKESSFLNRETSADGIQRVAGGDRKLDNISPPPMKEGIPIRR